MPFDIPFVIIMIEKKLSCIVSFLLISFVYLNDTPNTSDS